MDAQQIKANQTAPLGLHLLKPACPHLLLLTPSPHSGLCHLCRVSHSLPLPLPLFSSPSTTNSSSFFQPSSFGPIDQSTLIIWLLSSLLFFYFCQFTYALYSTPTRSLKSASLDLLILCSPIPCKKDDH
jgi:hypothetical protein